MSGIESSEELTGDYLDKLKLPLTLIGQGAEARLWRVSSSALSDYALSVIPKPDSSVILKERFPKTYRHPTLDATLTTRRTRAEARIMDRLLSSGVKVPIVYWPAAADTRKRGGVSSVSSVPDHLKGKTRLPACVLAMEDMGEISAKIYLRRQKREDDSYSEGAYALCRKLGAVIAALHAADVVHGDLTTSNAMLVNDDTDSVCPYNIAMIDFGLSSVSTTIEDKAVDLYVLERAFLCTHENSEPLVHAVYESYATASSELSAAKKPVSKKARSSSSSTAKQNPAPAPSKSSDSSILSSSSLSTSNAVLTKLDQVRQRGRKKLAFG